MEEEVREAIRYLDPKTRKKLMYTGRDNGRPIFPKKWKGGITRTYQFEVIPFEEAFQRYKDSEKKL
jgi:hypothetical protein